MNLVSTYPYAGIGYANPHAPTQIANGVSTSTFSYDNAGNLIQKTVDGTTTTYVWDYANRLIALGVGGATTTYGYDAFGQRVLQTTATTTTLYPFKWFSVASSTGTGAKYSTTTEYIWTPSEDTLIATVDQQFASGVATGSARTLYIHPDHLGSTNVVTNASGTVVQTLDYYPYGATRINSTNGNYSGAGRQYVNRFADQSSLDYMNARYYEGSRGQFLSQNPTFLALGDRQKLRELTQESQQNFLRNPQQMNSYSYANDNPINKKDPDGLQAVEAYKLLYEGIEWTNRGLYFRDISGYVRNGMPSEQSAEINFGGAMLMGGFAAQYGLGMAGYLAPGLGLAELGLTGLSYACSFTTCGPIGSVGMTPIQIQRQILSSVNPQISSSAKSSGSLNFGSFSNLYSSSVPTRQAAVNNINTSSGNSTGSGGGGGGGAPSNNSLWVTPSGAVVTFGGQLVAPPPPK